MPIPTLLLARNRGGAVGAYDLANGATLAQIGSDIAGAVAKTNGNDDWTDVNDIIEFKGFKYLVTVDAVSSPTYTIHKFSGGSWSAVATVTTSTGDARDTSGLFIYEDGTDVKLALFVGRSAALSAKLVTSPDGTTWTETVLTQPNISWDGDWILHKNELWHVQPQPNSSGVQQIDLVGLTLTNYSNSGIGPRAVWFEQAGTLYFIAGTNGGSSPWEWAIYKFTGAGFSHVQDISAKAYPARPADIFNSFPGIVVIGDDVYFWSTGFGADETIGSSFWHLTRTGVDTWTVVEDDTVIPANHRGSGANGNASDRWMIFIDTETDPALPEIYAFLRPGTAPGTGTSLYKFVNTTTEMTFETASVSTDYVFPKNFHGTAESVSRGSGNRAEVIDTVAAIAAVTVQYRVYGTGLNQTVKCYITDESGVPVTQATLKGTATGGTSTRNGNQIDSVDGDDGVTLYTFDIDIAASGLEAGEKYYLKLDIR